MPTAISKFHKELSLPQNYSGVVIEVDAGGEEASPTASSLHLTTLPLALGSQTWYQIFHLPEDYPRAEEETEQRIPGLSGFQLLLTIAHGEAATCKLNYKLQQYLLGSGWVTHEQGTITGAHAEGNRVWMDIYFEKEVPITETQVPNPKRPKAPTEFRLAFQAVQGIEQAWYTEPNPYAHGEAFVEMTKAEETAAKQVEKEIARREGKQSFNFRLLALTADSGTDFLGNPYRSVVVQSSAQAPSGQNTNSGHWLSSPQPSRFAVVSHYSDVRPVQTKPRYGITNLIPNPSFEWYFLEKAPALWFTNESYWTLPGATDAIRKWRGPWNKNEVYSKNEGVSKEGKFYESIKNNNQNQNPLTAGAFWQEAPTRIFESNPGSGTNYLEVKT